MLLAQITRLPMILTLMSGGALAMLGPALVAAVGRDWPVARAFFYSSLIFLVLAGMLALAVVNRTRLRPARAPLVDLVAAFTVLPVMLAVPLWESVPGGIPFAAAYFEMVSSLTTTGASVLGSGIPDAVHLWRALVGWLGGLLIWVVAVAILAPMSLGGFEVMGRTPEIYSTSASQIGRGADTTMRLIHYTQTLAPIYTGLTMVLWTALYISGDTSLVALSHAMSTLATSGISPLAGGTTEASAGFGGELLIVLFLLFALSRRTFTRDGGVGRRDQLLRDHELRLGLGLAATIPALLFLRHWVGAIGESEAPFVQGLQALWGGLFTVLSFLTTTGFESANWQVAQDWSGISTPGLIFIGLALVGGGVATTAGGIKLLRVYVLYRYSQREVERLVHPSAVARAPTGGGTHWRQGALIAWVFFMLLTLTVAAVMLALSMVGLDFEASLVLAVSALTTTGPLAPMVLKMPDIYAQLSPIAQLILVFSMVLGRLETLALIALLNPDFWRR